MKKYLVGTVTLIAVILLTFFVSTSGFRPIDTLMRPPKNEGQNKEIQTAFEESIKDKYILRNPISGEYRSSFILIDLDHDKDKEVIVFYSNSSAPDVARMNVLDKNGESWKSIADLETAHKQINCVEFSDLDGDKAKEIVVGWSILDTEIANTLNIYKICKNEESEQIECIFECNYAEFCITDIESDEKNSILVFSKPKPLGRGEGIRATYYSFSDKKVDKDHTFLLDPVITSISSVNTDKERKTGNVRFFVDGYRADSGLTTDLFYWDKKSKTFKRPLFNESVSVSAGAARNTNIQCKDVNADGSIDIPFEKHMEYQEVTENSDLSGRQQSVICWMSYANGKFYEIYHEIYNPAGKYSLKIKNDWMGSLAVKSNHEKGLLTFYDIRVTNESEEDSESDFIFGNLTGDSEKSNALFTILAISENESNFYDLSGYKYLRTENGYSYFCRIYAAGRKNGISKESIRKILVT